jgi:hypothetical protein
MAPPDDRAPTPAPPSGDAEEPGIAGAWVSTLLGVGLLGYTWHWTHHPSAQGLGRIFRPLYRLWGKWPIAIVFAAGGLSLLSIGLTGIVQRYLRKR